MDDANKLMALRKQGFYCSQMIMLQGLEQLGISDPALIRAMQGLAGGLGFSGELCGALTGGAALLGLYAGKGVPQQEEDPRLNLMVKNLVNWFISEYSSQFGGIRCRDILAGNDQNKTTRCPLLVNSVLQKANELLLENGFDLGGIE